jgi:hypothetical protein
LNRRGIRTASGKQWHAMQVPSRPRPCWSMIGRSSRGVVL